MKKLILFLVLSVIVVSIYDYTEYQLRKKNPTGVNYSLFNNISFRSVDNHYYLSYTDNFLKGLGWRSSSDFSESGQPIGKRSYFRRVPGYPLLYFVFVNVLGYDGGLIALIVFQHLLFAVSAYCFYQILVFLEFSGKVRNFMTSLYIVIPYFYSYCFYTLTESISPYLFIFYVYFLLKASRNANHKILNYGLASFFLGYAILTRPYMGLSGVLMLYFLNKDFPIIAKLKNISYHVIVLSVAGVMVLTWTIRNYVVTGEIVPLEKAYHPESLDREKPEFAALWKFVKCWEPDGSKMNLIQLDMFLAAIRNADTSQIYREKFMEKIPDYITKVISKQEINQALIDYQVLLLSQKPYYDKNIPMPSEYTPEQLKVTATFDNFVNRFKKEYPFRHYVLNPFKQLGIMVLHSNTSHIYLFQEPFRHIQVLNFIRYGLVLFHISLYVIMFLNLWWLKTNFKEVLMVSITPLLPVLFFMFIFQIVEQRYMLPFLPSLFIGLGFFLQKTSLLDKIIQLCKSSILKTNASPSTT